MNNRKVKYLQCFSTTTLSFGADDYNATRHSPISLEVEWAKKWWPNIELSLLFSVIAEDAMLAYKKFYKEGG
jgi:hypothetical protein